VLTHSRGRQGVPGDQLSRDHDAVFFIFERAVNICLDRRMRSEGLFRKLARFRHQRAWNAATKDVRAG
jgi:hypothetical protein